MNDSDALDVVVHSSLRDERDDIGPDRFFIGEDSASSATPDSGARLSQLEASATSMAAHVGELGERRLESQRNADRCASIMEQLLTRVEHLEGRGARSEQESTALRSLNQRLMQQTRGK